MQRNSTKGEKTKEKIYLAAKEMFYEKGYNKTSIKLIAAKLNIATGNLTYYFPTKDFLITEIFNEYYDTILKYVKKNINVDNYYFRHYYTTMIFNINIFRDLNTKKFYYETLLKKTLNELVNKNVHIVYKNIIDTYKLRITQKQYKYLTNADFGARREVLITYIEENDNIPVKDLACTILENTARLFGIPEIDTYLASFKAYKDLDNYDFSFIKLLV